MAFDRYSPWTRYDSGLVRQRTLDLGSHSGLDICGTILLEVWSYTQADTTLYLHHLFQLESLAIASCITPTDPVLANVRKGRFCAGLQNAKCLFPRCSIVYLQRPFRRKVSPSQDR